MVWCASTQSAGRRGNSVWGGRVLTTPRRARSWRPSSSLTPVHAPSPAKPRTSVLVRMLAPSLARTSLAGANSSPRPQSANPISMDERPTSRRKKRTRAAAETSSTGTFRMACERKAQKCWMYASLTPRRRKNAAPVSSSRAMTSSSERLRQWIAAGTVECLSAMLTKGSPTEASPQLAGAGRGRVRMSCCFSPRTHVRKWRQGCHTSLWRVPSCSRRWKKFGYSVTTTWGPMWIGSLVMPSTQLLARPPMMDRLSTTVTFRPRCASGKAAASPATPAPTITTSTSSFLSSMPARGRGQLA
mmetsp:Transcript_53258/g.158820  ORF Transcript_53258/g.158820 Transcript_53258/m.158820 type:complete len:301 (+) Transcript_53258:800-1702(+)